MRLLLALLLGCAVLGCAADKDPLPEDTPEQPETDLPETDLPETDLPDTDLPDTDPPETAPPPRCAPDTPTGTCPGTATCVDGRCLIDLDPRHPVPPGAAGDWDAIASYIGTRSLLLDTRPIDWAVVSAEGHAAVAAAPTRFAAAWAMVQAAARHSDGHTGLRPAAICQVDPGYGTFQTNTGACAVEAGGEVFITSATAPSGFLPGDVLLSIDGRPAADLIEDRLAQPRCGLGASTPAGVRHRAVLSLLYRPEGERSARVRRAGQELDVALTRQPNLNCTGRVGAAGEEALVDRSSTATLPGGVSLIAIGQMGVSVGSDFRYEPLVDALRAHLAALPAGAPLILDVRGNTGGHTEIAQVFADWLTDDATAIWRCRQRLGDAPADVGELITSRARPDPLVLTGPVAVLTDPGVYGSAEFLPRMLEETGRGASYGGPTSGSFGISWQIPVSDWGAIVNALRCERADGSALDGDPDPPDVPVVLRAEDAAAGVDTVIEAARRALVGTP